MRSTLMRRRSRQTLRRLILAARLNLLDTYTVLILVYSAWQVPTVLWFMRGFFEVIPPELEEAALVDGCSRLQALYRVVLPVTQPGLAVGGGGG